MLSFLSFFAVTCIHLLRNSVGRLVCDVIRSSCVVVTCIRMHVNLMNRTILLLCVVINISNDDIIINNICIC